MSEYLNSGLALMINEAVYDCFDKGSGRVKAGKGLEIWADWIDSKRPGYSVIEISFIQDNRIVFYYEDYNTECVTE